MYAVTVVLQDAEEAERARMINLRATAAEESKADLGIFSAATGTVDRSAVLAEGGRAVSAKDEGDYLTPAT
jgi:hypothetical protein